MLVLSRKVGSKLTIGETTLTVLKVRGNQVRLGIDAPDNVVVMRAELAERELVTIASVEGDQC